MTEFDACETSMKTSEAAALSCSDVLQRLQVKPSRGLSDTQAEERRKVNGLNEFIIKEDDPLWKKYLKQVRLGVLYLEGVTSLPASSSMTH